MMINRDRLAKTFTELAQIDSESGFELEISETLAEKLRALGADVFFDYGDREMGSNTGNIIAGVNGNVQGKPIFLCGHMDTVKPGRGVKVAFRDGVFTSEGNTILGGDDKSALAIILEVLSVLEEKNISHIPLEIIFTVCEEIGLKGAKGLDYKRVRSDYGYVLDIEDVDSVVKQAPALNMFTMTITGKEAHAGNAPEEGVNAIQVAADAVGRLPVGRIDQETTCNVGKICGGLAANIVPGQVVVQGEIRSHNPEKLVAVTSQVVSAFEEAVEKYRKNSPDPEYPKLTQVIENEFLSLNIPEEHPVIQAAIMAAENLGREMKMVRVGGGSDLNVLFQNGKVAGVIGTGMTDVHTLNESIKLDDMVKCAELVLEIIRIHSAADAEQE